MSDEWTAYPGHDPANPPPGATPGNCMACQGTGRTWREYMAVGPLVAMELRHGEVGTVPVLGPCRYCKGHGWTWHTKLR